MACSLYNNGGFGCGACVHFIKSLSMSYSANTLTITVPEETVKNKERFCICLAQNIPDGVNADTVVNIAVTNVAYPFSLLSRCGNRIHGDQLRTRTVLHTMATTDIPAFRLIDNASICPTEYTFTTIVPTE